MSSELADLLKDESPPLFWPDIDLYFHRNLDDAYRLIDAISDAGGKFLKGAVLQHDSLCLNSDINIKYYDNQNNKSKSENYHQVIRRHTLPLDILGKILSRAKEAKLKLVLSVYDQEGLDFALDHNACAIKIPSSNITHKSLILSVARCGIPMVLDTGRSRFNEIISAYNWIKEENAENRLIIQHSPPGPPAAPNKFNLKMMQHMAHYFNCPTGLSDHHPDITMFPLAVALGARVIEKGLVLSKNRADIDTSHSLNASRISEALALIENSWDALGENIRPDSDVPLEHVDRMCIIAGKDISVNEIITHDMISFAFPPIGICAQNIDLVVGKCCKSNIPKGTPLMIDDINMGDDNR